eukprot:gene11970-8243_t
MIYTPTQLLHHFADLLDQHRHADVVSIQMASEDLVPGAHPASASASASIETGDPSRVDAAEILEVSLQFRFRDSSVLAYRRPDVPRPRSRRHSCLMDPDEDLEVLRCVASCRVVGSHHTITRKWCAQLQRIMSTAALLTSPTADEEDQFTFGCQMAISPVTRRTPPCFRVELLGLLPTMVWRLEDDGVFGSHQYILIKGLVQCPHPDRPSLGAAGGSESDADAGAASGARASPAGEEQGAAFSTAILPCVASFEGPVPIHVGVALNAGIPMGPEVEVGRTVGVLVLHAVDLRLLTTDAMPEGDRPLFRFAKQFTTTRIMPRVSVESLGAAWRCGADGALQQSPARSVAEIGTSYVAAYHVPQGQQRCPSRVHNLVIVVGTRRTLWEALLCGSDDAASPAKQRFLLDDVASQVAAAITAALRRITAQNTDLFAFPLRAATRDVQGEEHDQARSSSCVYTDDMLRQSIAENITRILFYSRNPEFVQKAEHLLFGGTPSPTRSATALPSHSYAEIRQTIEKRLQEGPPESSRQSHIIPVLHTTHTTSPLTTHSLHSYGICSSGTRRCYIGILIKKKHLFAFGP